MTGQQQLVPFAIKSYRYLRLSIVVIVAALMLSVLLEVIHAGYWQESISAYYYTPTHAIFVGGLVAIGVALIAVKGSTDLEETAPCSTWPACWRRSSRSYRRRRLERTTPARPPGSSATTPRR